MRTFLITGRPGSGKGTQARVLADVLHAQIFSTGTETRKAALAETSAGRKFKEITERGYLMPEWFIKNVFTNLLLRAAPDDTLILDGFCRMKSEAELFEEISVFIDRPYKVLHVDISEDEARVRLGARRTDQGRGDDAAESIERRFREFRAHTEPALAFFRSKGRVTDIDGMGTPEEVFERIRAAAEAI